MRAQPIAEDPSAAVAPSPPFRLRHLLAFLIVGSCLGWVWPRAEATLQLHNRAAALADYALCMVGPTGVDLVVGDPGAFMKLVRRRVVSAAPEDKPLVRCASLADKLELDHTTLNLHQARAADIAEYENDPSKTGRLSLAQYRLPQGELEQLAEEAWPFVRSGYAQLMQASSHTKEAAHPVEPPSFAWGSGLPAGRPLYRSTAAYGDTWVAALGSGANRSIVVSTNGGIDWTNGGRRLASDLLERCVVDEEGRGFTLSRLNSGERIVVSQGPGAPPQVAVLGSKKSRVAGISCDDSALVAALVAEKERGLHRVTLRFCPFRRPCRDLELPELAGAALYYPADIARVGGDIVLSRSVRGITRVTSSRDEGRSWTPWVVVYDSVVSLEPAATAPHKLLVVGDSLLLYGSPDSRGRYPLLLSTNHGASFHSPVASRVEESPAIVAEKQ